MRNIDVMDHRATSHARFLLRFHLVFVVKWRRKALLPALLDWMAAEASKLCAAKHCAVVEFGGEADHVHLLVDAHPAQSISKLVASLKSALSKSAWKLFAPESRKHFGSVECFGRTPIFAHPAEVLH